jgi:uroporphyrinogen-III synthase
MNLQGKKILVTRSKHQCKSFSDELKKLGAIPIELPLIEINPPDSWDDFDRAFKNIEIYDWIIFASANAVESTLKRAEVIGSNLGKINIAAIGPATMKSLQKYGLTTLFSPNEFIAETLVKEFPGYPNLSGKKILWTKTNIGRTYIADELKKVGADIDIVYCYKTSEPANKNELAAKLKNLLDKKEIDIITLASSQTVKNLANLLDTNLKSSLSHILIAVIGPQTSEAAIKYLDKIDIEAKNYTMEGLIEALRQY